MIYKISNKHHNFNESCLSMKKEELNSISEDEMTKIDSMVSVQPMESSNLLEYKLCIPKAYAREESNKAPKNAEDVPHYELYIERQIGTSRNRRSTYVFWKLPKSGRLVAIEFFMDGGVDFKKDEHKYILRETDELDRRIVLGFCLKYEGTLLDECYSDDEPSTWLNYYARTYQASQMPKRLKHGNRGNNFTWFYKGSLRPYEECGIFKNVLFI